MRLILSTSKQFPLIHSTFACLNWFLISLCELLYSVLCTVFYFHFIMSRLSTVSHPFLSLVFLGVILFADVTKAPLNMLYFEIPLSFISYVL